MFLIRIDTSFSISALAMQAEVCVLPLPLSPYRRNPVLVIFMTVQLSM